MGVFELQRLLRERFPKDSIEFRRKQRGSKTRWVLHFNGAAVFFHMSEEVPEEEPYRSNYMGRLLRMALRAIYREMSVDDYVRLQDQNLDRRSKEWDGEPCP